MGYQAYTIENGTLRFDDSDDTFDREDETLAMKSINEMEESEAKEAGMFIDPNGEMWDTEEEYHAEMILMEAHLDMPDFLSDMAEI